MNIKMFDLVKSINDKEGIKSGTIGTVVEIWKESELYEIEFSDESGNTLNCVTMKRGDFTPLSPNEIAKLKLK